MRKIFKYLRLFLTLTLWRQTRTALVLFLSGNVDQIRRLGALGDRSVIFPSVQLAHAGNIFIGENVRVSRWVCLWAGPASRIVIGDHSSVSPGTFITSDNHGTRRDVSHREQPPAEADVIIGADVWIGANCTILPGVTIQDGAVIGAGAVVTKDIPANAVAVGNPARVVKYRAP